MPHAALLVVQDVCGSTGQSTTGFNAARGFVGGASTIEIKKDVIIVVSMPHAALLVVQEVDGIWRPTDLLVSMPHAALLVVQGIVYHLHLQT